MATAGYVRVSSADHNDTRQLAGIECDKLFTDTASGKDTNRPELRRMLEFLREGFAPLFIRWIGSPGP